MRKMIFALLALVVLSVPAFAGDSREIGAVSTAFQLVGPNHKIVVSAFDDPKIKGITCYVARPKTGGIKGGLGLAEDPSLGSVSCVQTGPVSYTDKIDGDDDGEKVFDEHRSLIFKTLQIDRLYDHDNGSLVYIIRTTRVIEGSPMTAISVVAPAAWNGVQPGKALLK